MARVVGITPIIFFRALLALLVISTISALRIVYAAPERFEAAFPGAVGVLKTLFLADTWIGLIALAGLFFWKRWALALFLSVSVVAIVLDVLVRAPFFHQIAVVVCTLLVLGLSLRLRQRFK